MRDRAVVQLYESLARFQWWRARRGVTPAALDRLELRKRLRAGRDGDGPADGAASLDAWLRELAGGVAGARVLDLGCGFGASLLRAIDAGAKKGIGITPSRFQVDRARRVAAARGVADRCRFDAAALEDELPAADLVLAVEALGHTERLREVLAAVAAALAGAARPRFVWLEDLYAGGAAAAADQDLAALADAWSSPPLCSVSAADAALAAAGLRVTRSVDLTAQVPRRSLAEIDRSLGRIRWARRLLPVPSARRVLDAFVGGLRLERLYARDAACYRVIMAEPVELSER